jgi:hypothetical protein
LSQGLHEDLERQGEVKAGSDRAFGLVFAAVFLVVGLWPLLGDGGVRLWALAVAALLLAVALLRPALLGPANRLWLKFGELLHRIVSPVVLGVTFLLAVLPVGLLMRLTGKDPLSRKFDPQAASYWIPREPAGPAPETMKDQF